MQTLRETAKRRMIATWLFLRPRDNPAPIHEVSHVKEQTAHPSRAELCLAASTASVYAQSQAPDNTATNRNHSTTADNQSHAAGDRDITKKIRQSLMADKNLSTYGHNCKIITQNGAVTLKGPVHSDDERMAIEQHAADVVGKDKVTNQLTVKQ
jgi:hyperosmotically inducible protein